MVSHGGPGQHRRDEQFAIAKPRPQAATERLALERSGETQAPQQSAGANHIASSRLDSRQVEPFGVLGNAWQPTAAETGRAVQRVGRIRLGHGVTRLAEPASDVVDRCRDLRVDAAAGDVRALRDHDPQPRRRAGPGRGGRPARMSSMSAASSTVRERGPTAERPNQWLSDSRANGTRPGAGLKPKTPQHAAGIRIEPPPSDPSASAAMRVATATALPPLDPPAVCSGDHGLRVTPNAADSVKGQIASSGIRVLPSTTHPAVRRRRTNSSSAAAGRSGVAAEPCRVGNPATSTLSFTATGTPASGPFRRDGSASTARGPETSLTVGQRRGSPMRACRRGHHTTRMSRLGARLLSNPAKHRPMLMVRAMQTTGAWLACSSSRCSSSPVAPPCAPTGRGPLTAKWEPSSPPRRSWWP